MSARLDALRREVEELSVALLAKLNERATVTVAIADEKHRRALPTRDLAREAALMERLREANHGPFDDDTIQQLFQGIIDATVSLMGERAPDATSSGLPVRVAPAQGSRRVVRAAGHTLGDGVGRYIAGPCAVESAEQIDLTAAYLAAMGVEFLRGGTFKPRTSPYSFQGLGRQGLKLLAEAGRRYGLATVTEATGLASLELVAEHADIIQIGARNMHNYDLLRAAGETGKPVLLKRSFGATLKEWLLAAEYVALAGSEDIVLCERGIRTFARETRATLDLSAVPLARAQSQLPVIVDVSHAAGRRDILGALTRAAFAAGADAVMVEVHPDPDAALSDAAQQLSLEGFEALARDVRDGLARVTNQLAPLPRRVSDAAVAPASGPLGLGAIPCPEGVSPCV